MKKITLEDFIELCNFPVELNKRSTFIWSKRIMESRLEFDGEYILRGRGFYWGSRCDWGEKEYIKDFLFNKLIYLLPIHIEYMNKYFSVEEFKKAQNSFLRLQNDTELYLKCCEEEKNLFEKGYSSLLAYVVFRAYINKVPYLTVNVCSHAIEQALKSAWHSFVAWKGWRRKPSDKKELHIYELEDNIYKFGKIVAGETVSKCIGFCSEYLPKEDIKHLVSKYKELLKIKDGTPLFVV